jgi:hypothetical protein
MEESQMKNKDTTKMIVRPGYYSHELRTNAFGYVHSCIGKIYKIEKMEPDDLYLVAIERRNGLLDTFFVNEVVFENREIGLDEAVSELQTM